MKYFSYIAIGRREEQQDAIWIGSSLEDQFFVVADGVGGQRGGRSASQNIVCVAESLWGSCDRSRISAREFLERFVRSAHEAINEEAESPLSRARSTIVALLLSGGEAHWIHSGDCRLYHIRNGSIVERTFDHTVVQILFSKGEITEEEMGTHPDQGRLLQSLGGDEFLEPDYNSVNLEEGTNEFFLCSDGFWEYIKSEEIAMLFSSKAGTSSDAQELLDWLGRQATERAGDNADNISSILVRSEKTLEDSVTY